MAESSINVTEGSGKRLHTWDRTIGGVLVQSQGVFLDEYPYASYVVTASAVGISVANDHILQIMAGSSNYVRIRSIEVTLWTLTTSSTLHRLELWRLSTAGTGGTTVTPAKLDSGDAAAGATAMTLPTAKGTEATKMYSWGPNVVSAVANQSDDGQLISKTWVLNEKPLIIPAGTSNGIALKNISTQATGQMAVNVEFVETAWLGA